MSLCNVYRVKKNPYLEHISIHQQRDCKIRELREAIVKGSELKKDHPYKDLFQFTFISQGTVYVRWEGRNLVIIPQDDVSHFIISAHVDSFNPHIAADKLTDKLREYGYFENMNKLVRELIAKCVRAKQKRWKVPLNIHNVQRPVPPFRIDKRRFLKFHLKNGHVINFLCDTGANSNCLTYQDYEKLSKPNMTPSLTNLTVANGTPLDPQGLLKSKLIVKGTEQKINFEVSKAVTKSILGEEALSLFRIVKWDLPQKEQT